MLFLSFLLLILYDGYSHFNGQKHHSEFIKNTAPLTPVPELNNWGRTQGGRILTSPHHSAAGGP